MTDAVIVLCTCGSRDEASGLARRLVQDRLAACVNIVPEVASVYRWQGKIEEASEVLLIIKTTGAQFARLRERIAELHSYDTPEIIAVPIADGSARYLEWLCEQVSN